MMEPCSTPNGEHTWRPGGPECAAGSTLVVCDNDGCDEIGYRLTTPVWEAGGTPSSTTTATDRPSTPT